MSDGLGSECAADVHSARDAMRKPSVAWITVATLAAVASANLLILTHTRVPYVSAAAGVWLALLQPTYLLCTTSVWPHCGVAERLGYSLGTVVLALMTAGLACSAVLPLAGIRDPLSVIPVVILTDALNLSFYLLRLVRPSPIPWRQSVTPVRREELRVGALAALSVVLAVLGANRLNNGAGGQVSMAALGAVLATMIWQICWTRRIRDGAATVIVYLVSLALLLTTSLRGWYVTGHDIQNEYRVFQLTATHSRWSMSYWHNAYEACLSITILPTEISRLVQIDDPYIFKVIFQMVFAVCPVLVYMIARRHWSSPAATLAVAYFVGFPTFFTDMPFLNRQEIAYLFVAVGILGGTHPRWSHRRRLATLLVAGIGVEISHYSTMYFLVGALAIGWTCKQIVRLIGGWLPRRAGASHDAGWAEAGTFITLAAVLGLGLVVFAWGTLITQTSGQVATDVKSALSSLSSHATGDRSGNVGLSVFGGNTPSDQTLLGQYASRSRERVSLAPDAYLSRAAMGGIRTPHAVQELRPLTSIGHALTAIDVPVASLNGAFRQLAAYGEQLFLIAGILGLVLIRRRRAIGEDFFWLCIGCTVVVALITVLPGISADYGVLRAFQEALVVISPVIVLGSTTAFQWLRRSRWAAVTAPVICFGFFAITSSFVPQMLGDNVAELNLNNSGPYYNAYYMHPQEEAAVGWLSQQPGVLSTGVQGSFQQDRFAFTSASTISGHEIIGDIYPTLVRRSTWAIASYSMVHERIAVTSYSGNLIEYVYPLGILLGNKSLVYSNGGSEIFK